jgi:hypothetical protein
MMSRTPELPLPLTMTHLLLRLRVLNQGLRRVIAARREATERQFRLTSGPGPGAFREDDQPSAQQVLVQHLVQAMNPQARLYVSDQQVDFLLAELDQLCQAGAVTGEGATSRSTAGLEKTHEAALRAEAKRQGLSLPLDRLEEELPLSPTQVEAIVLCAATEFAPAYETVYSFILNDVARRLPCAELFCTLAEDRRDWFDRRLELGRFGRLRLLQILVPVGEAATELRQEFRLATGLFDYLLEGRGHPGDLCGDRAEVGLPDDLAVPPHVATKRVPELGHALQDRTIEVVGVWGPRLAGPEDVALAIARAAGGPLRRWTASDPRSFDAAQEQALHEAIQVASMLDAILWVSTDALTLALADAPGVDRLAEVLADALAAARVRVLLTGPRPWQPARLLAARPFQSWELAAPDLLQRATIWEQAMPGTTAEQAVRLAAQFPWGPTEVRAAARLAAITATTAGRYAEPGSRPGDVDLEAACTTLDRQNVPRFATLVIPRRGKDDLVLPEPLKTQVLEVADFHRSWPTVSTDWGFGRMVTGSGGIRALFTGEPGTGKTLAAEVIASRLGRPLLNLDLSQIVSKWVGETEKHLDSVFRDAEERDSVLLLDEADSLLGKRGEIRHGSDRYAALEVSYLLQRLEQHPGLCLMASNHKENIDPGFMRRFQAILAFPRPGPEERRRIWQLAFPKHAAYRLSPRIPIEHLARLDMTGAAIVESARTAALLAAGAGQSVIAPEQIIEALRRQFQRESRILSSKDLEMLQDLP